MVKSLMTHQAFFIKLKSFVAGFGNNYIELDRGHVRALLQEREESLDIIRKLTAQINEFKNTQLSDQATVNSLESELEISQYKLNMMTISRNSASIEAEKLLQNRNRLESLDSIDIII